MRVVGQFNLGFMICLLGSDLFIMDQHACDEKYNFEVLQETTTIHQQPLVRYICSSNGVSVTGTRYPFDTGAIAHAVKVVVQRDRFAQPVVGRAQCPRI